MRSDRGVDADRDAHTAARCESFTTRLLRRLFPVAVAEIERLYAGPIWDWGDQHRREHDEVRAQLAARQKPAGVTRILLGEGHEPRRCLTVPTGSVVAVDLAAEYVAEAVAAHVPEDLLSFHHDSTVTTPSDRRDWNALRGFQSQAGFIAAAARRRP